MISNPFDDIAVEEALRQKEKHGGEVIVVSIGSKDATKEIRSALAMGADRGILVHHEGDLDSHNVALTLKAIIAEESPDCILMGKQAIDDDSNQASQILAEMMGWGQATQANTVTIEGDDITVIREADGGLETVAMKLPAVVTTDLRLNEPRYPNLPGIMKAKRKPLAEKTLGDLGVEVAQRIIVKTLEAPVEKEAGQLVPDVATLINKLQNEAKAL